MYSYLNAVATLVTTLDLGTGHLLGNIRRTLPGRYPIHLYEYKYSENGGDRSSVAKFNKEKRGIVVLSKRANNYVLVKMTTKFRISLIRS